MTEARFTEAAHAAVAFLDGHTPLDLWLLTHVHAASQTVLVCDGVWAGEFPVGTVLPWLQSLDLPMSVGAAPATALRVSEVPAYAAVATGRWSRVRGYTGVTLMSGEGELFGTLAGFSFTADDRRLVEAVPPLEVVATLLSTVLTVQAQHEVDVAELARELATVRSHAETDELTGLLNRRGWRHGLSTESVRCTRYGTAIGVLALDLDELKVVNDRDGHAAGDTLLRRVASLLQDSCRPTDILARTGGDEFGVLAVGLALSGVETLVQRVVGRLHAAGIAASVAGVAHVDGEELTDTWERADLAMYRIKRARRAGRPAPHRTVETFAGSARG